MFKSFTDAILQKAETKKGGYIPDIDPETIKGASKENRRYWAALSDAGKFAKKIGGKANGTNVETRTKGPHGMTTTTNYSAGEGTPLPFRHMRNEQPDSTNRQQRMKAFMDRPRPVQKENVIQKYSEGWEHDDHPMEYKDNSRRQQQIRDQQTEDTRAKVMNDEPEAPRPGRWMFSQKEKPDWKEFFLKENIRPRFIDDTQSPEQMTFMKKNKNPKSRTPSWGKFKGINLDKIDNKDK